MRSALISPLQAFTLAIANEVQNEHLSGLGVGARELQPLVYSSLIQAGLEKLIFSSATRLSEESIPSHVMSRIQRDDVQGFEECLALAATVLKSEDANAEVTPQRNELPFLWAFLGEVLYSLRTRRPVVTFFDMPKTELIRPFLPPELGIPILNFLDQLKESSIGTGAPVICSSIQDVALCEEILADARYRSYASRHGAIEETTDRLDIIGSAIASDVRAMKSRHRQLQLEKVGISTLKISTKFIDKVLLGIPGKLGDELASAATSYLEDRQRLVVYKFVDMPRKIFSYRMKHAMSNKLKGS